MKSAVAYAAGRDTGIEAVMLAAEKFYKFIQTMKATSPKATPKEKQDSTVETTTADLVDPEEKPAGTSDSTTPYARFMKLTADAGWDNVDRARFISATFPGKTWKGLGDIDNPWFVHPPQNVVST